MLSCERRLADARRNRHEFLPTLRRPRRVRVTEIARYSQSELGRNRNKFLDIDVDTGGSYD
jgi:hypothetical protein